MLRLGMARTAVVIDREYLKHDPGEGHPERPERIRALLDLVGDLDRQRFQLIAPRPASRAEIESRHDPEYIALIEATSRANRYALDGDTVTSRDSFAVALLAVGGFLELLDAIAAGESDNGFALVRPPGHHALKERAMGFCLFNTMAIGADYLKRKYHAGRVLIVDWDVHHGNGTQEAFYDDPSVLFISTHQFPFYPGTGAADEVGAGAGEGFTINIPLPAGCSDGEYVQVFNDLVLPAAESFQPEWVLVSAGFDPHRRDPLAGMALTEEGFSAMARMLLRIARRYAAGRIALLLEGGYDLAALSTSTASVLEVLQGAGGDGGLAARGSEKIQPLIRRLSALHERYR
ncbi:MAG TPA: histone deacetylase [Candidatus Eisenbacteria bacterium]|nr:histone deacetylase [Candidatus Eisenbacteria bacterium]